MPQLQASITFDKVQAQPQYQTLSLEQQAEVASDFFSKHVESQPQYQALPAPQQQEVRSDFYSKYKIQPTQVQGLQGGFGDVQPGSRIPTNTVGMMGVAPGLAAFQPQSLPQLDQVNQGQLSGLSGLVKGATLGYVDPYNPNMGQQAESLRQIPEFIGQLFPFEAASTLIPGSGASLMGRVAKGAGAFGAIEGLSSHPGQQLDLGARLQSAGSGALQGAGWELGLTGLGKALGFLGQGVPKGKSLPAMSGPKLKGSGVYYGDYGRPAAYRQGGKLVSLGSKELSDARDIVQHIGQMRGIDAVSTKQMQAGAYKKAFNALETRRGQLPQAVSGKLDQAQAELSRAKAKLDAPKLQQRSVKENTDEFKALVSYTQQLRAAGRGQEARVALGTLTKESRAKIMDAVSQNENALKSKAAQEARAIQATEKQSLIEAKATQKQLAQAESESIKRQKALQAEASKTKDLKHKQAVNDRIALEKAESQNRRREMKQLQADIKARSAETSKVEAAKKKEVNDALDVLYPETKGKTSGKRTAIPVQTQAGKLKEIRKAIDNKKALRLEYEAEKSGETGAYRFKKVSPYEVAVNKNGVVQVKAINEEGQIRTYLLGDESGSRIVSAKVLEDTAPHEVFTDAAGKVKARTIEGEVAKQVQKQGVKSSELRANLEQMHTVLEKVKKGESVSTQEILDAVKPLKEHEFVDVMKDIPEQQFKTLAEEHGC